MNYYLAPSLVQLRDEVNKRWPKRDKASDGWIGDTSHSARASDHNPDWSNGGIVRAIDIDNNGTPGQRTELAKAVLDAAIGDDRVWYVIWNHKIYSRTYGWRERSYTGSNPHDKHIHISARKGYEGRTGSWLKPTAPAKPPKPKRPKHVREAIKAINRSLKEAGPAQRRRSKRARAWLRKIKKR